MPFCIKGIPTRICRIFARKQSSFVVFSTSFALGHTFRYVEGSMDPAGKSADSAFQTKRKVHCLHFQHPSTGPAQRKGLLFSMILPLSRILFVTTRQLPNSEPLVFDPCIRTINPGLISRTQIKSSFITFYLPRIPRQNQKHCVNLHTKPSLGCRHRVMDRIALSPFITMRQEQPDATNNTNHYLCVRHWPFSYRRSISRNFISY